MADNVIVRVPEQQFIRGEDGYSPEVTIENIDHGHSITITDREHQEEGQTFNVLDGDSAYEQAVAGGYTGTEAQFNEELASFKELSDEAKDAAPFYAEYGVTTKAEIETAINGKRQIYVHSALGMDYAPLVGTFLYLPMFGNVPQTGYRFATVEGTTQYIYDLRDEWFTSENDLAAPAQRAETAAAQALTRMNSADASAQAAAATATTFTEQTVPAAVNTINEAKADALTAVGNAQATAVGAVQQESTTQQAAIQQKGDDVLESIPADYTDLSNDVDNLKSALKSTVYLDSTPVAFSVDGTGYVKYAAGDVATSTLSSHTNYIDVSYFKSLQYKRQGTTISNPASGMAFYDANLAYISGESGAPSQAQGGYLTERKMIEVPPTAQYARFTVYTDVSTYGEFELYGETKIANEVNCLESAFDEQLQYNAFNVIGLCPNKQSRTSAGITFTWIDEFTCSISGTSTGTASATIFNDKTSFPPGVKPGSRLRMSAEVNTTLYAGLRIAYYDSPDGSDKNIRTLVNMATGVVTDVVIPETATGLYIRVQLQSGKTVSDGIFKPCILVDRYTSEEVYDRILGSVFNLNSLIGSTLLTSGDDLFTLPVGLYHANSGTGAANSPTDAGYKLVIFVRANASQKTALLFATDGYAFTNACDSSNNWSSWKRLTADTSDQLDRLPNYYTDYMASRIGDVNKLENEISRNSDSFVFITDYHIQRNAGNSLKMIKQIVKETGITKLFFGGDAYQTVNSTESRTDEQAMAYARKYVPAVYSSLQSAAPEFYSVFGNHEWNHLQGSSSENLKQGYELNLAGVYNYCLRRHESSVSEIDENGNFYVDNTSQKIRYFFLQEDGEARPSNAALNWLGDQLMLVPSGYYVAVICHFAYRTGDYSLSTYSGRMYYLAKLIPDILQAYNTKTLFSMNFNFTANSVTRTYSGSWDFTNAPGNNVIAIFSGHIHSDAALEKTANNVLCIATTGDLHKNGSDEIMTFVDENGNTVSRTPGTVYEQAFDVCHIDIPNRKLYMTRFGGGVDREFEW